jgi:hypothetical protein
VSPLLMLPPQLLITSFRRKIKAQARENFPK